MRARMSACVPSIGIVLGFRHRGRDDDDDDDDDDDATRMAIYYRSQSNGVLLSRWPAVCSLSCCAVVKLSKTKM